MSYLTLPCYHILPGKLRGGTCSITSGSIIQKVTWDAFSTLAITRAATCRTHLIAIKTLITNHVGSSGAFSEAILDTIILRAYKGTACLT